MNNDEGPPYLGPFDKDTLEQKAVKEEPLSEKDFIQESRSPSVFPAWLWLFLVTVIAAIAWGSSGWYEGFINKYISSRPFLEVTNRNFSLFLWQFPSFLRANVKQKTGYLTGFQYGDRETVDVKAAEEFVVAPPDLLFLYHTWHRLLASDFIERSIPAKEFAEFLEQDPEWQPKYWKEAPKEYAKWINTFSSEDDQDLQKLPTSTLPQIVRQAFQGWKNYFKEGPQINELSPTFGEVKEFLKEHPYYARNYWRNIREIAGQQIVKPQYLESFMSESIHANEKVSSKELASFLKVALFNAQQAKKEIKKEEEPTPTPSKIGFLNEMGYKAHLIYLTSTNPSS